MANETYYGHFVGEAGANLLASGAQLLLAGDATLSGLALSGSGGLEIRSTASVSNQTIGGKFSLLDSGTVTQTGDVTLGDSNPSDQASLTIGAGGVWNIANGSAIKLGASTASIVTIGTGAGSGLLEKTGAGVGVVKPMILNNGANIPSGNGFAPRGLLANGGSLDIAGAVLGNGSDTIMQASTLEFDAFVGAGQTVTFFGANASLALFDLPDFKAAITGFDSAGSNDSIVIAGGWTFTGASETASAATLTFSHGDAPLSLTLTGDYQGKSFAAQDLGNGLLKIS